MNIVVAREIKNSWKEHIHSLFYDKQRMSEFYLNLDADQWYDELVDLIKYELSAKQGKRLQPTQYSWLLRQCNVNFLVEVIAKTLFIKLDYRGISWFVYFLKTVDTVYIVHLNYEL
jgi:hypothetical protein